MKNKELFSRFILIILMVLTSITVKAGIPLWTFQPLTATTLTVPADGSATVQYQVANHSSKLVNLIMQPISGITASGCTPVARNQTCVLTLQIDGANLPASVSGGPILCNQSLPLQCYRPSSNSELQITRGNISPSLITVTGSPLLLPPNTTGYITVTNNGSRVVTNIHAILPAGLAANVTQDASNCLIVLPGQSCHLKFTANNQLYPATSFSIVGTNTVTKTASIGLNYSSITDADVNAVAYDTVNGLVYLGGSFTYVGPNQGGGAPLDINTGIRSTTFPRVNGRVDMWLEDGSGGWYISGLFNMVGDVARNNIAHVLSDNTVDPNWNPNADQEVFCMTIYGSTMYVGGGFNTIGGQPRIHIAALDVATGLATSWYPGVVNDAVFSISLDNAGSTVYFGGQFFFVNGQPRNELAAVDATTGLLNGWNPNAGGAQVSGILVNGATVYVWGSFMQLGGQVRHRVGAVDATTGLATPWNPDANGAVFGFALNGSTIYLGGRFTNVGGQARNRIAEVDATTGTATAWNPNADNEIDAILVDGSTIYVGGYFSTIGGQVRTKLAALDATTGLATSWNPLASDLVTFLTLSGSTIYAGGYFYSVNGVLRNSIAALDASTGLATSWNPNATLSGSAGTVNAITLAGSTVYIGGDFDTIGVDSRNNIAAVDASTGLATSWDANANSTVLALTIDNTNVYAGGSFTNIGGQARNRIAALDIGTALATSWNPNANSTVNALIFNNSLVYAGGSFTNIGGQSRNRIAALDASTGLATSWDPNASGVVNALAASGDGLTLYAGGTFNNIGGQGRNRIGALSASTGLATSWDPNANSTVNTLGVSGSTVYAGGNFTNIGGQPRNYIAALDGTTGLATNFNPGPDAVVFALALSGSSVYFGGDFLNLNGLVNPYFGLGLMDFAP